MWCLLNGYRPPHEPHGYRQSEESWGDDYQAIEEDDDSDGVGVDDDHSDDNGGGVMMMIMMVMTIDVLSPISTV